MEKNWLIRTKSNHILGPISKEKVVELYKNGSIKPDDEVCSGNGYWFFIREDDMVKRFILGDEFQAFNPISEAKDVLTHGTPNNTSEVSSGDITLVSDINLSMLKQSTSLTANSIPPIPNIEDAREKSVPIKETIDPTAKKKNNLDPISRSTKFQKPLRKQNYLSYIALFGFIVLCLLVYFRRIIIQSLFKGEVTTSFSIISPSHAQVDIPDKKKS
jgi:hypothetical protein